MNATTQGKEPSRCRIGSGRIVDMADREEEILRARFEAFQDEWRLREPFRAAVAFERFREALERHTRWEEESLFEEFEKRCLASELIEIRRHHRLHEALVARAAHIAELIAQLMGPDPAPTAGGDLAHEVHELDDYLTVHRECELHEVCCRLDAMLSPSDVDMIAEELAERGSPKS